MWSRIGHYYTTSKAPWDRCFSKFPNTAMASVVILISDYCDHLRLQLQLLVSVTLTTCIFDYDKL